MSDKKPPIPFTVKNSGVPIVGQPVTVLAWFPSFMVMCNCLAPAPVLIVGFGSPSYCPACGRGIRVFGARQDIRDGKGPHFDIDVILPTPPVDPNAPPV